MLPGSTRRPTAATIARRGINGLGPVSLPLNIAEGNGKTTDADRRRCFEIARGSALECAAIQDVLVVGKALDEQESLGRKTELDRMAAMLSRLGGRGCSVAESSAAYRIEPVALDPDFDPEDEKPQPAAAPNRRADGR